MREEGYGLNGLAQSHFISEDPVQSPLVHGDQPVQSDMLVLAQRELKKERHRCGHGSRLESVS
jgi:hypothetical protein